MLGIQCRTHLPVNRKHSCVTPSDGQLSSPRTACWWILDGSNPKKLAPSVGLTIHTFFGQNITLEFIRDFKNPICIIKLSGTQIYIGQALMKGISESFCACYD